MPVKPDKTSIHKQILLTDGKKWHQTISVVIKNSNVLVQPINLEYIHITMHPNSGTKKLKNCHLRISKEDVKRFTQNGEEIKNKGMLVEWNRNVSSKYDCPLEFIFPNNLICNDKASFLKEYDTQVINYEDGTLYLNFWFTEHNEETIKSYFDLTGATILLFDTIEKTNENFALTYHIDKSISRFNSTTKTDDYFEIGIKEKNSSITETNKLQMMFGLSHESKKTIVFY